MMMMMKREHRTRLDKTFTLYEPDTARVTLVTFVCLLARFIPGHKRQLSVTHSDKQSTQSETEIYRYRGSACCRPSAYCANIDLLPCNVGV